MMFLSDAELVTLTGYRQPAAQIRYLDGLRGAARIRFIVNAAGRPVIARVWIEGTASADKVIRLADRPNLAAIRRRVGER